MTVTDLGIHFIIGLSGPALARDEAQILEVLRPAGIIIFSKNLTQRDWATNLKNLISEVKVLTKRQNLLVSIDHEGGKVHRLPEPATRFPEAWYWDNDTVSVSLAMAKELSALGINLSFAPVLDIHSEPTNPVIAKRAFSDVPQTVARQGLQMLEALEVNGILACGKHFPGHGGTISDSHLELPVVTASEEMLRTRELVPFKAAIQAGVKMLMSAHVCYPAFDANCPATLSRKILNDLLRKELGYKHVVISDAIEMKALDDISREDVARQFLLAGGDMILIGQSDEQSPAVIALNIATKLIELSARETDLAGALKISGTRINELFKLIPKTKHCDLGELGCKAHLELAAAINKRQLA
ncbi:beta-N-acetylhexosaminidase [bacterium]|nr:beta-N-acetylhexosaminidase [bacterium]